MPIPPPGPGSFSVWEGLSPARGNVLTSLDRNSRALTGYLEVQATIGAPVEASALTHTAGMPGLRGPSALLRLQSDERLIALTRRGQSAAFETLCSRYQSRLLAFCRHMLGSREDAEDVLQEVFAAAFNAVLADERDINVRPWLYRIARNRSLNHLRRASAIGVDSMDVHFAEHGLSTGDRVIRRESFRELLADVQELPETQRTALLLREMDALSYEQIADAMETTVPSVKSLLVRARISLAEAAESRKLSCAEVRLELGEVAEGLSKLSSPARRHVRGCERCGSFKKQLKDNNHALAAMLPVGPLLLLKKLFLAKLGSTASAGGAHVAGGAGATVGAGAAAGAGATGGTSVAGGIITAGAGALATKAVAGLAAAAIVTAGVAAADHTTHHARTVSHSHVSAAAGPVVIGVRSQPASSGGHRVTALAASHHARPVSTRTAKPVVPATAAAPAPTGAPADKTADPKPDPAATQVTQVTAETTQLPSAATPAPAEAASPLPGTVSEATAPSADQESTTSTEVTPPPVVESAPPVPPVTTPAPGAPAPDPAGSDEAAAPPAGD
jgi:RNA polymerase sigma factor (sigma-70 family)